MESAEHPHELQELLAGYALGNLSPEESIRVQELLKINPEAAVELERLQSILAITPLSLPEIAPSPQLEQRILRAAQTAHSSHRKRRHKRLSWRWIAAGSAAAIAASLGFEVYRLRHNFAMAQVENQALQEQLAVAKTEIEQIRQNELASTRQELSRYQEAINLLRQPNSRYLAMKGMEPDVPSTGSLVISVQMDAAVLTLRNVPVLPESQTYRMWAIVNDQKVACGDFVPNASGDVFVQLPVDEWGETPEVVITIEPEDAISEPVGDMVIVGS